MSIAEMQACLANLYTSDRLRALLRDRPDVALRGYDLSERELAAIKAIDAEMLEVFAGSLKNKRRKRFDRAFRASFALLGPAFEGVWLRYLELYGSRPARFHDQVLDFGRFAEQTVGDRERFPDYACDLVRFERLAYEAAFVQGSPAQADATAVVSPSAVPAIRPGVVLADFRYDVAAVDTEASPTPPALQPNTVVFRPRQDEDEQRMLRVNDATAVLLRRCDGVRTVVEIVEGVATALSGENLSTLIEEAISRLQDLGAVTVASGGRPA